MSPRARLAVLAASVLAVLGPALARADIVSDLDALRANGSDGGAVVTAGEIAGFRADLERYSADETVQGIVHVAALRGEGAFADDASYGLLQQSLRFRVAGLAMSPQAPGIAFARDGSGVRAELDPRGVDYADVAIVYTTDGWRTGAGSRLLRDRDGRYRAVLPLGAQGQILYALRLLGPDGQVFWINNGRDTGVAAGALWLDYRFRLEALDVAAAAPSRPALAQLVRSLAAPASPGAELVTSDDFSLLVESLTFEGGFGVHESELLLPALRELDALRAEGVAFEGDTFENMRRFVQTQLALFPRSDYPGLRFQRGEGGLLSFVLPARNADGLTLIFTTDGWSTPKVAPCTRSGGDFVCRVGFVPPGTFAAFAPGFRFGHVMDWQHEPGNRNFFQAVAN